MAYTTTDEGPGGGPRPYSRPGGAIGDTYRTGPDKGCGTCSDVRPSGAVVPE